MTSITDTRWRASTVCPTQCWRTNAAVVTRRSGPDQSCQVGLQPLMRSPQNCGAQEPANTFVQPGDPVATERANGGLATSARQAQTDQTGPAPLVQAWKRH